MVMCAQERGYGLRKAFLKHPLESPGMRVQGSKEEVAEHSHSNWLPGFGPASAPLL